MLSTKMKQFFLRSIIVTLCLLSMQQIDAGIIDTHIPPIIPYSTRIDDSGFIYLETQKNVIKPVKVSDFLQGVLAVVWKRGYYPLFMLSFQSSIAEEHQERLLDLSEKARHNNEGELFATICITLSNGEQFYYNNCLIRDTIKKDFWHVGFYSLTAEVLCHRLLSNRKSKSFMDMRNWVGYVLLQFQSYNIKKVEIDGIPLSYATSTRGTFSSMILNLRERGLDYVYEDNSINNDNNSDRLEDRLKIAR